MSEKDPKVDSEDDDDDDDYCPTKNANEQSDPSDESAHDDDENDQDEKTESEKQNDLSVKPYDESKTNELWKNFTSSTKSSSTATKDNPKTKIESPKPATESPKPASKIFDYAGEKVSVPVTATAITSSLKRPAPSSITSNSLLDRLGIGKKPKLSTLEKSRLDWSTHKQSESLTDDLDSHRRGKDSYVEKTAFLQRTETREHDHYLTRVKKK